MLLSVFVSNVLSLSFLFSLNEYYSVPVSVLFISFCSSYSCSKVSCLVFVSLIISISSHFPSPWLSPITNPSPPCCFVTPYFLHGFEIRSLLSSVLPLLLILPVSLSLLKKSQFNVFFLWASMSFCLYRVVPTLLQQRQILFYMSVVPMLTQFWFSFSHLFVAWTFLIASPVNTTTWCFVS